MPYDLSKRLVIGLASSALFNLEESDKVFREGGENAYREYQREKQNHPLKKGVAFSFVEKLLSINEINRNDPPVEVILLSRNDPDTGFRVMNSIEHYKIGITRALFLQGKSPYAYINALDIDLFLSANETDVKQAILAGYPAGQVLKSNIDIIGVGGNSELRIALDFDGVIADDEAEKIFDSSGLNRFHQYEEEHANDVHQPGPLASFLKGLSSVQKQELKYAEETGYQYLPKLRISIVTARNAPSHKRVINTMRAWDITINEAFFLGGIEKAKILKVLNPDIFFDDQKIHLDTTASISPSVHIPFGIKNI
ncbi:TPA: 5'-nucleotidase [Pasteurella multocida]|uniref:5'-nucleotidase n=2 Tax=Pasteurella multocida TaxID=747 RepID=UPI0020206BCB|nr:5'-nucleotidase [Pasteurella multocida]MCL7818720.1 5'-nucleotidase [Pasteurella multocida]MEB3465445.1 5'-nucleotidase [Pasteurella multocida]MEB3487812.1 5'-nucleotidase [Pasteurella multocida]MEB3491227.1 5'-nucleotidase [Pasteurella multocida]WRK07393.1 5'-nucleotidase [Pasteurella multocida]